MAVSHPISHEKHDRPFADAMAAGSRYRLRLSCAAAILCAFIAILIHPLYALIFLEESPTPPISIPPKLLFLPLPLLLLAFPFALWRAELARRATLAQPPTGRCAKCGYDMRATPLLCPECGTIPTPHPDDA